jgi:urease accessory protein
MTSGAAFFQLLRLASPGLPVGAYCYSQGLETAIELGFVHDVASARDWIAGALVGPIARFDAALVGHARLALHSGDEAALRAIDLRVLASRETREQRDETLQMGYSLRVLVESVPEGAVPAWPATLGEEVTFPVAWAIAAHRFGIDAKSTVAAFLFGWLENQVVVLMKVLPLGHIGAQQLTSALLPTLARAAATASELVPEELCNFAPMLGFVAMRHETQYSRLFRS